MRLIKISLLVSSLWLFHAAIFSAHFEIRDDLEKIIEQIAGNNEEFVNRDGDQLRFFESKVPLELGPLIARGGTKTAFSSRTDEPGDWVVLFPNPNKRFSIGLWYNYITEELKASEKLRALGPNFTQEYRLILISDAEGQNLRLTLAARSFVSLALEKDLIVFDHKESRSSVLSRFVMGQIFSGVEPEMLEEDKIWQPFIQDLQRLLQAGLPKAFTHSDSVNLGIKYKVPQGYHEKMRSPLNYNADDTILNGRSNGISIGQIERILTISEKAEKFAQELGCAIPDIRDSFFVAKQFPFSLERGDSFTLFLFDADHRYGLDTIDLTNREKCKQYVEFIVENIVAHAAMIFLTDEQYEQFIRDKSQMLIKKITHQVLSGIYS